MQPLRLREVIQIGFMDNHFPFKMGRGVCPRPMGGRMRPGRPGRPGLRLAACLAAAALVWGGGGAAAPPAGEGAPIQVGLGVYVLNLGKVDMISGTWEADFYRESHTQPGRGCRD